MKRVFSTLLAVAMTASVASASNLNVSVKATANDTNAVSVAPGAPVAFYITGDLSDNLNEGLALVGYNLHFTGGPLSAGTIDTPTGAISCLNPMRGFVKPDGITNPAGFGGTLIGGDLIQVGGAQNTIKNTVANAAFPIGTVLTGNAQPIGCGTATLATGSLTAPAIEGTYELQLSGLFANVIKAGEIGDVFWATEAAGAGTIGNLMITVGPPTGCTAAFVSATPACGSSLPRAFTNVIRLGYSAAIGSVAGCAGVEVFELDAAGADVGVNLSASFSCSDAGGNTLRIEETGTVFTPSKWYRVSFCETTVVYRSVPGDANNDGSTTFGDLSFLDASMPGTGADDLNDINADGTVNFGDLSASFSFNGTTAPAKPATPLCP